ncbi:hypothetical protein DSUL_80083 [Desulfovibrionales bacterium]
MDFCSGIKKNSAAPITRDICHNRLLSVQNIVGAFIVHSMNVIAYTICYKSNYVRHFF